MSTILTLTFGLLAKIISAIGKGFSQGLAVFFDIAKLEA
jgi:hypothetical protein